MKNERQTLTLPETKRSPGELKIFLARLQEIQSCFGGKQNNLQWLKIRVGFQPPTSLPGEVLLSYFQQSRYQQLNQEFYRDPQPEDLKKAYRQITAFKGQITRAANICQHLLENEPIALKDYIHLAKNRLLIYSAQQKIAYDSTAAKKAAIEELSSKPSERPILDWLAKEKELPLLKPQELPELPPASPSPQSEKETNRQSPAFPERIDVSQLQNVGGLNRVTKIVATYERKKAKLFEKFRSRTFATGKERQQAEIQLQNQTLKLSQAFQIQAGRALKNTCPEGKILTIPLSSPPSEKPRKFWFMKFGRPQGPSTTLAFRNSWSEGLLKPFATKESSEGLPELVIKPELIDEFLASYLSRRQLLKVLLLGGAALATTAAFRFSNGHLHHLADLTENLLRKTAEKASSSKEKFANFWLNFIKSLGSKEKVSLDLKQLATEMEDEAEAFFRLGETAFAGAGKTLWEYFIADKLSIYHPQETIGKQPSEILPYPDIPPQLVADYLRGKNRKALIDGLVHLYARGYFAFNSQEPLLYKDVEARCEELAKQLSKVLDNSPAIAAKKVDEVNPDSQVKDALIKNQDIAEQLLHFALLHDNNLAKAYHWRRNNVEATELVDWCLVAHLNFIAWRWFEQAYAHAVKELEKSSPQALTVTISKGETTCTTLSQALKKSFPGLKPEDTDHVSVWLSQQPGAIASSTKDINHVWPGDTITLNPLWHEITRYLLEGQQKETLSLDMIFLHVDTEQLGKNGLQSNQPDLDRIVPAETFWKEPLLSQAQKSQPELTRRDLLKKAGFFGLNLIAKKTSETLSDDKQNDLFQQIENWSEEFKNDIRRRLPNLLIRPLDWNIPTSLTLTADNGEILAVHHPDGMQRYPVKLSEISSFIIEALIDAEDHTFWHHPGVALKGIVRAALSNGEDGGGSTITQQSVKNRCFTDEERRLEIYDPQKRMKRKQEEIVLALIFEQQLTREFIDPQKAKEHILECYLNTVFFGRNSYGIQAAAENYFGKSAGNLSLEEAAFLIGLLQEPYGLSQDLPRALEKRNLVLDMMSQGDEPEKPYFIPPQQVEEAKRKPIILVPDPDKNDKIFAAPHFVSHILTQTLPQLFPEGNPGGIVKTSLNLKIQENTQQALVEHVAKLESLGINNGAVMVLDASEGKILALAGNVLPWGDQPVSQVNLAKALHLPGSTLKPYVAAKLFSQGYPPTTPLSDALLRIPGFAKPIKNDQGKNYWGLDIAKALVWSLNQSMTRAAAMGRGGAVKLLDFVRRAGVPLDVLPNKINSTVVMGSVPCTVWQEAFAAAVLANRGRKVNEGPVLRISDSCGDEVYSRGKIVSQPVISEQTAKQVNDILAKNTLVKLFGPDIAVKTGTADGPTDGSSDCWTLAYTTDEGKPLVVVCWMGHGEGKELSASAYGENTAAPLAAEVLKFAKEVIR